MKTPPAPPYLLPPEESVIAEEWRSEDGGEIGGRLDHWDPFTNIEVARVVSVDVDTVRATCQLGPDAALAVTASWFSNRTRLSGEGPTVELGTLDGRLRAPVSMSIPGPMAGGRLDLHTRLVVRHCGNDPSPISPMRAGAVLWTQRTSIDLEGAAARFPVTPANFTMMPRLPDHGAWALEWDPEALDAPVLGSVRLLVNTEAETFIDALRSGGEDTRAALVRSFVTYDVARSLIHGALRSDRFVEEAEAFEDGSVGRMLFELVTSCWPGLPVSTLAQRRVDDAARLDAELQSYLGVVA